MHRSSGYKYVPLGFPMSSYTLVVALTCVYLRSLRHVCIHAAHIEVHSTAQLSVQFTHFYTSFDSFPVCHHLDHCTTQLAGL